MRAIPDSQADAEAVPQSKWYLLRGIAGAHLTASHRTHMRFSFVYEGKPHLTHRIYEVSIGFPFNSEESRHPSVSTWASSALRSALVGGLGSRNPMLLNQCCASRHHRL